MNYYINQPGSLGDILFTLKIGEKLQETGNVIWNVAPVFWNRGLNRMRTTFKLGVGMSQLPNSEVISLCDLTTREDPNIMTKKYEVVGIEWEDWSDYIKFDRDLEKEKSLFEYLELREDEPFILVNETYGVFQKHYGVMENIPSGYDGKIVKLQLNPNFTIFDWCLIFEKAEQIHTIDTSIQYVIETLDTTNDLVVYPRHYKYTIPQVSKLFSKPWNWIESDRETWLKWAPEESEF